MSDEFALYSVIWKGHGSALQHILDFDDEATAVHMALQLEARPDVEEVRVSTQLLDSDPLPQSVKESTRTALFARIGERLARKELELREGLSQVEQWRQARRDEPGADGLAS